MTNQDPNDGGVSRTSCTEVLALWSSLRGVLNQKGVVPEQRFGCGWCEPVKLWPVRSACGLNPRGMETVSSTDYDECGHGVQPHKVHCRAGPIRSVIRQVG